ncbi:MAG: hypothetical protein VX496_06710, partial [Planctomycetota bacterium]|nr:hypothetical protein [Planctomycetota bacterium]
MSRLLCCILLGGWVQGILPLAVYPADPAAAIEAAGIRGSLVICGGGKLPEQVTQQFMKLAGGTSARLVIIPTASTGADKAMAEEYLSPWRKRQPASLVLLHTRSSARAAAEDFIVP